MYHVSAQVTKITGYVTDATSGEAIPFCNVYFAGTQIGGITDFNGQYFIETLNAKDTLSISFLGYKSQTKTVKYGAYQEIDFELERSEFELPEVKIRPGKNPALVLLEKVIENKEVNHHKEIDYYQYEVYSKLELDANNISEKFRNRRIMKPFQFYFEFMDTSTINGKKYLPVFISESLSDYYFRNDPKSEREVIKAARISGIENESLLTFLGNSFQEFDFYDNYIEIVKRNFVSPIADFSTLFYKYYLVDSAFQEDKWCYRVMFKERRKQENTFTGYFWVHDTTYAIQSYEIKISESANLNYINDLVLYQEYDFIDSTYWMVTKEKALVDFNILEDNKKVTGFFGKKTTTYKDFIFHEPQPEVYKIPVRVMRTPDAMKNEHEFWDANRHIDLTKKELAIYHQIDTLKSLPIFRTWVDIIETLVNGHWELPGKANVFEFGPYASVVSNNTLEGTRIRVGGRTTKHLSKEYRFDGHVAYGTLDKRTKYEIKGYWQPSQSPLRKLEFQHKYEIEQLSSGPNAMDGDLFFMSLLRRGPANRMSLTREYNGSYTHEWFTGFSNNAMLIHKQLFPTEVLEVQNNDGSVNTLTQLSTAEFRFDTRLAYDEKFMLGDFSRINLGTNYPVVNLEYGYGIPNFFGSDYEYHKMRLGIKGAYNIGVMGRSRYRLETGKTWGTLPYPLLNLQPGNETFIYGDYSFSLMNYFEFVTDEYASLFYIHHFQGFFLNHFPLIKKLKWREVAHIKGVAGGLSTANLNYNILPDVSHSLTTPYVEAGVGVENIFKIFRLDAVWRLTHRNYANKYNFGIMFSMNIIL